VRQAENCFARGLPAIVSVHSINFHSTVQNFRDITLQCLDQFFGALEAKHGDLLYLHDENLLELVNKGFYATQNGATQVNVTRKDFRKGKVDRQDA